MFGALKAALAGEQFSDDNAVEVFVRNRLEECPTSFYDNVIKKLPIRWESAF